MKNIGLALGTFGVQALIGKAKNHSKNFQFVFDISTETGAMAYEMAVRGKVRGVQELEPTTDAIRMTRSGFTNTNSLNKGFRLATPFVPILSYKKNKGYEETFDVSHNLSDGTLVRSFYGVHLKTLKTRAGSIHHLRNEAFYAATMISESTKRNINEIGATYKFEESYTNSTSKKLTRFLGKLAKRTSMDKFFDIAIDKKKNLGYTHIDLKVDFSKGFLKHMMQLSTENRLATTLLPALNRDIDKNAYKDIKSISKKAAKIRKLKKSLSAKIEKIQESLLNARYNIYLNANTFSKEMVKFGKSFLSNKFLFKAVFEESKKCGVNLTFEMKGKRISRLTKNLTTKSSASCLETGF